MTGEPSRVVPGEEATGYERVRTGYERVRTGYERVRTPSSTSPLVRNQCTNDGGALQSSDGRGCALAMSVCALLVLA